MTSAVSLLVVARRLVVVGVLVVAVVALVLLGQAQVDHRLAQRASHAELPHSSADDQGGLTDPFVNEVTEVTGEFRGLPSRHAGVSHRHRRPPPGQPLIPADTQEASGWSARMPVATSCSRRNAAAGSAPSGATAITPPQVQMRRLGDGVRYGSRRAGRRAPTARLVVERDLDQAVEPTPGAVGAAVERRHQARPVHRVDHIGVRGDVAGLVGLHLAHEVQGEVLRASGGPANFAAASWSRFSPTSLTPSAAQQLDVGRGEVLRHGDEGDVCRARPAGGGAGRDGSGPRTAARPAASSSRSVGHGLADDDAGEPPVLPSRR